ncbi:MAG: hypothetical protein HC945_02360, partial [Nitrosarchaeum sp.]|nr:hypothetical protein [Nitrosarchaeum sp.]
MVLVDNAQFLSKESVALLHRLCMADAGIQVIVAGPLKAVSSLASKDVKDELKISLGRLGAVELEEVLRRRIADAGGIDFFPFERKKVHELAARSKGDVRVFLSLCREEAIRRSLKVQGPPQQGASLSGPAAKSAGAAMKTVEDASAPASAPLAAQPVGTKVRVSEDERSSQGAPKDLVVATATGGLQEKKGAGTSGEVPAASEQALPPAPQKEERKPFITIEFGSKKSIPEG